MALFIFLAISSVLYTKLWHVCTISVTCALLYSNVNSVPACMAIQSIELHHMKCCLNLLSDLVAAGGGGFSVSGHL